MTEFSFSEELNARLHSTFGAEGPAPNAPPVGLVASNIAKSGDVMTVSLKVKSDSLHIRSKPDTTASLIGTVGNGGKVTVIGAFIPVRKSPQYPSGGGFYPVKLATNATGFAWAGYLFQPGKTIDQPAKPLPVSPSGVVVIPGLPPGKPGVPNVPVPNVPGVPGKPGTPGTLPGELPPKEVKASGFGWGIFGIIGLVVAAIVGVTISKDKAPEPL